MGDTSHIVTTAAASTVLWDTSPRKDKQDVRTEWIAEKCDGWNYWTCLVWIHTLRKKESHREKRWQRYHENTHGKVLWVPDDILSGGVVDSLTEYWHSMSSKVSCNGKRIKYDEMRWCRWNVGKASMHSVSKPLYWTVVFQPSRDGVLNFFDKHGYTIGYMQERKKNHGKKSDCEIFSIRPLD